VQFVVPSLFLTSHIYFEGDDEVLAKLQGHAMLCAPDWGVTAVALGLC
jgi:hypothetical protein